MSGLTPASLPQRFLSKLDTSGDCWLYTGTLQWTGYARYNISHRERIYAHRYAYELLVGPIPQGAQLDHLCLVKHCVNPGHLEPVTPRVNVLRSSSPSAVNHAKDACLRGHPFDETNTYHARGRRYCVACQRENVRQWRARKKATA